MTRWRNDGLRKPRQHSMFTFRLHLSLRQLRPLAWVETFVLQECPSRFQAYLHPSPLLLADGRRFRRSTRTSYNIHKYLRFAFDANPNHLATVSAFSRKRKAAFNDDYDDVRSPTPNEIGWNIRGKKNISTERRQGRMVGGTVNAFRQQQFSRLLLVLLGD